jgi:hypothetical protein
LESGGGVVDPSFGTDGVQHLRMDASTANAAILCDGSIEVVSNTNYSDPSGRRNFYGAFLGPNGDLRRSVTWESERDANSFSFGAPAADPRSGRAFAVASTGEPTLIINRFNP